MNEDERIRLARRRYMQEYRERNKARIEAINKRFWLNHYDAMALETRALAEASRDLSAEAFSQSQSEQT